MNIPSQRLGNPCEGVRKRRNGPYKHFNPGKLWVVGSTVSPSIFRSLLGPICFDERTGAYKRPRQTSGRKF